MKIYSNSDGELIALRRNEIEELEHPVLGFQHELEFDEETNVELIANYHQDHNGHRLIDGVLSHNGIPYVINPPGEEWNAKLNKASTIESMLSNLASKTPTEIRTIEEQKIDDMEVKAYLKQRMPKIIALLVYTLGQEK